MDILPVVKVDCLCPSFSGCQRLHALSELWAMLIFRRCFWVAQALAVDASTWMKAGCPQHATGGKWRLQNGSLSVNRDMVNDRPLCFPIIPRVDKYKGSALGRSSRPTLMLTSRSFIAAPPGPPLGGLSSFGGRKGASVVRWWRL